jgi:hypothetical protein
VQQQQLQAGELAGPVVNALKATRKVESLCSPALTDMDYQATLFFYFIFFNKFFYYYLEKEIVFGEFVFRK